MNTAENRAYWNERAALGETAGTQDRILTMLERQALIRELRVYDMEYDIGLRMLEIGCGLGEMAREVALKFGGASTRGVNLLAIDNSVGMLERAQAGPQMPGLAFQLGDVADLPPGPFHVVYTERCLINLPSWDAQKQAIDAIASRLCSGGWFLMCEHSEDGLGAINTARATLDLSEIEPPWHNRYFRDEELTEVTSLRPVRRVPFSATYYVLSRVVNAALAHRAGHAPDYQAPINLLALEIGNVVDPRFAQGVLWVWEKP